MKKSPEIIGLEEKYNTVLQIHSLLSDTQNLLGEIGRGAGKTTEMFAPRMVRVSYDMPRSTQLIAGPTYTFILENILPNIITYLAQNYTRGIQFEYGKEPPKHFNRPLTEIKRWAHTISFAWGTVIQFASADLPESVIGKNSAHLFVDELLRISETSFRERIRPALRGDRSRHGHSPYFAGITGFSSTPNFENDHDWWLDFEQDMDKELVDQIMYVAHRVMKAKYSLREAERVSNQKEIKKLTYFINRWERRLKEKRKGATTYLRGSSFTNLLILGKEYIEQQMSGSKTSLDKFKLAILGIRPNRVKNMFFARFENRHIFEDSYKYNNIELYSIDGTYKKTSRDLAHCDPGKVLVAGWDPGHFMSIVFAQEHNNELRCIKNFFVISPDQHEELAHKVDTFFIHHGRKILYLHYDRAGNQKIYKNNPKGETDALIFKTELEKLGWTVNLMSIGKRTIAHWEHYMLLNILFGEKEKKTPRVRICQNECEELISSIRMSPLKKTDGVIQLDKTSEKKLDYEDQAFWSTQLSSALMYLLFGLYEKYIPDTKRAPEDIEGL